MLFIVNIIGDFTCNSSSNFLYLYSVIPKLRQGKECPFANTGLFITQSIHSTNELLSNTTVSLLKLISMSHFPVVFDYTSDWNQRFPFKFL